MTCLHCALCEILGARKSKETNLAPALLTPACSAGNRSQAKGERAGCVPKLAGMLGKELEHNFLGSTGAQERPWQRPQRSMGGHRGLQGHFGRQVESDF